MTLSRRKWFMVAGVVAATGVAASVFRTTLRPEDAWWERHLESQGGTFHLVPGHPGLAVCFVEFQVRYGMRGVTTQPALFVRNEGSAVQLDGVELRGEPDSVQKWTPQQYGHPREWDRMRQAKGGVPLSRWARTLVLCGPLSRSKDEGAEAGAAGQSVAEIPRSAVPHIVKIVLDGQPVQIPAVNVSTVSGQGLGLVPYFFAA